MHHIEITVREFDSFYNEETSVEATLEDYWGIRPVRLKIPLKIFNISSFT